jgi:hypothetical protein
MRDTASGSAAEVQTFHSQTAHEVSFVGVSMEGTERSAVVTENQVRRGSIRRRLRVQYCRQLLVTT